MRSPSSRRSANKVEIPTISPIMEEILNRVEQLSDLDLRKELSSRSFSCGPIVGTTRSVYKKKLVDMLLDEELPAEARIARAAPSSEEDEEEEEEVVSQPKVVNGGRKVAPIVEAAVPDEAVGVPEEEEEQEEEEEEVGDSQSQEESSEEEDVDEAREEESQEDTEEEEEQQHENVVDYSGTDVLRHRVPGPSDSFETKTSVAFVSEDGKTVKRTTTTTTRVLKASDISATYASAPSTAVQPEKTKKKSSCLSILFQMIVIAIILFFVYVIVMGPSSPLGLSSKPHDVENPPLDDGAN